MGRISESLKKNIDIIREADRRLRANEPVDMTLAFELEIALRKINYFTNYCVVNAPDSMESLGRFVSSGELENFNLPENLEEKLAQWEEGLDEAEAEYVFNRLATQDAIPPFVPDLHEPNSTNYINYVKEVIDGVASFSSRAHLGISEEGFKKIMVDIQQDFIKTSLEQDYIYDENNEVEAYAFELAERPFQAPLRDHRDELDLADQREFMTDANLMLQERNEAAGHPNPLAALQHHQRMAKFLLPIQECDSKPKDLAEVVQKSVMDFQRVARSAANSGRRDFPTTAEFLSLARDRVEAAVLDRCVELGDDPNSVFLKQFLKNPVEAMTKYYENVPYSREAEENTRIQQNLDSMRLQQGSYNNFRQGKVDRYDAFMQDRRNRADRFIRESIPSFNPATFKSQYRGGVFERALHRTSPEWQNVSAFMENWSTQGPENGNLDKASDLATKYLQHKFPGVDPKNITVEMCESLDATGRSRSLFCLTVIDSVDAAKAETMNERIAESNRKVRELRALVDRPAANFQQQLANDLANEEVAENNNEIQNNNEIHNENEIQNNDIEANID